MSRKETPQSKLIELLAMGLLSLPEIALVADVIAADARFNLWMSSEGKGTLSRDELMKFIGLYEDLEMEWSDGADVYLATRDVLPLEAILRKALTILAMRSGKEVSAYGEAERVEARVEGGGGAP